MEKQNHLASIVLLVALFFISQHSTAKGFNYPYAFISITGDPFSDKLNVKVDFGDNPEQIIEGEKLSEILSEKTSYASVLNYMSGLGFVLVETMVTTNQHNGNGGTSGFVFIMRKKG
ncbi:hypothetical protein [Algoriphagus machipongonensis]|uniref:Uncharacterized protein n=1 Tax=Algoriphagus machipongonensis TaxID=388413 RepID=A3HZX7_9BACT|nr:hypothetical protein [Algoriphagus machipongonensis]EAZ80813.1 hypothetical protein ALPR1_07805 [Algoriphagus machipongonensis]